MSTWNHYNGFISVTAAATAIQHILILLSFHFVHIILSSISFSHTHTHTYPNFLFSFVFYFVVVVCVFEMFTIKTTSHRFLHIPIYEIAYITYKIYIYLYIYISTFLPYIDRPNFHISYLYGYKHTIFLNNFIEVKIRKIVDCVKISMKSK